MADSMYGPPPERRTVETNLFIGGPMDGKRQVTRPGDWEVVCPRYFGREEFALAIRQDLVATGRSATYEFVRYRRQVIGSPDTRFLVWTLADAPGDEMLQLLIDGYSPAAARRSETTLSRDQLVADLHLENMRLRAENDRLSAACGVASIHGYVEPAETAPLPLPDEITVKRWARGGVSFDPATQCYHIKVEGSVPETGGKFEIGEYVSREDLLTSADSAGVLRHIAARIVGYIDKTLRMTRQMSIMPAERPVKTGQKS